MFVQLDLSCRRRRRWRWAVPLVLAALLLALPQLAALRPAALARVDRIVGGHYMTRLDALQQENFTLHQQLAQSADALAENAALTRQREEQSVRIGQLLSGLSWAEGDADEAVLDGLGPPLRGGRAGVAGSGAPFWTPCWPGRSRR